jgi:ribonucleoside-diphosphate reductase alpha chain
MAITKLQKRDGRLVEFVQKKITDAIFKAAQAMGGKDYEKAQEISDKVVQDLDAKFKGKIPSIEDVQDTVERVLMENGHTVTAKAYILYRQKHSEVRKAREAIVGMPTNLKLSLNTIQILKERYLRRDNEGNTIENPEIMFRRVAYNIAKAEEKFKGNVKEWEEKFYNSMVDARFMPNSPTLMNAGRELGQLSACFVLPIDDSIESIFETVKQAALIHKSGGGTGFSFGKLRPKNSLVSSSHGKSSGPISFMRVFNEATDAINQGGFRRGANMAILPVTHPDIIEFISCKEDPKQLNNFNISVAITDEFMRALKTGGEITLSHPKNKNMMRIKARQIFDLLVLMAWKNGEPGVVFIDKMNKDNPTPQIGQIESTNPCVTGDTLISTSEGLMRAKELEGKETEIVCDKRLSQTLSQSISEKNIHTTKVFKTGFKKVFKMKTHEGYELNLTENHKVLTTNGWIEARELKKGDEILIQDSKGGFGAEEKGTLEQGRVLGWLVGDGTFSSSKGAVLSFFGKERAIAPKFAGYVSEIIGDKIAVVEIKGRDESRISSTRLQSVVESFGITAQQKVIVPDYALCASEQFQRGFLQGIFSSDGHIAGTLEKGYSVRLTSISADFLKDIQRMLLNFGIASKLYLNRHDERVALLPNGKGGVAEYNCKPDHDLVVSKDNIFRFLSEISFICEAKQNRLVNACASYTKGPYKETFTARFKELVAEGEETVYDLTEPVTHSFIANGLVVHNCGEQPLLAYESCNLGSINLAKYVKAEKIDWDGLREIVQLGVRFLDDVVEINNFPMPEIEKMTRANRKIGLGVMGFADMLFQLGIPYNSEDSLKTAEQVMKFVTDEGRKMSEQLGKERGSFPNFKGSIWEQKGCKFMRNATVTTIAPTGTISMIAECSSGIEPLFAVVFIKRVLDGKELLYVNEHFKRMLKNKGLYSEEPIKGKVLSEEFMEKIANSGSLKNIAELPDDVKKIFVVAHDITPEWHIKIQAAFQKYTDNAVSKTVNFSNWATTTDVEKVYMMAYDLGCKGVTVYRDGSRDLQVLNLEIRKKEDKEEVVMQDAATQKSCEKSKGKKCDHCPDCGGALVMSEGCSHCPACGYSACSIA